LIFTFHLQGRTQDLYIYGPKGLDEIITLQLKYSESILNYEIHFQSISEESPLIFENEDLWVKAIKLNHRIPTFGFLFEEKPRKFKLIRELLPQSLTKENLVELKEGQDIVDSEGTFWPNHKLASPPRKSRKYAYMSDTRYLENDLDELFGVNLLYHEATFLSDMQERAENTFHSTAAEAAKFAKRHQVDQLVLGHFSSRYYDTTPFLEEARQYFIPSCLAVEGQVFDVPAGTIHSNEEVHAIVNHTR
jgi:ribonuclease Z